MRIRTPRHGGPPGGAAPGLAGMCSIQRSARPWLARLGGGCGWRVGRAARLPDDKDFDTPEYPRRTIVNSLLIAAVVLACCPGGIGAGLLIRRSLPEHHL